MESYIEMGFDQLVADAMDDSVPTAAEIKVETTLQSDEQDVIAYLQCDEDEKSHGEKSDLSEKPRFDYSPLMEPINQPLLTINNEADSLGEATAHILNRKSEPCSESLIRLVESSEYVFNGFEELLEGSSSLLGGIEKLIHGSKSSMRELSTDTKNDRLIEQSTEHSAELGNMEEDYDDLSPLVSLTALEKASDLENEKIRLLQEQIHAMNESIHETDAFIKQCQRINDKLTEECQRLDECTNGNFPQDSQINELQIQITAMASVDTPAEGLQLTMTENLNNEIGSYQTVDPFAPNFDRWSMLYGRKRDPSPQSYNQGRVNLEDENPRRYQYYAAPNYEELESIWESGEEEEEEHSK